MMTIKRTVQSFKSGPIRGYGLWLLKHYGRSMVGRRSVSMQDAPITHTEVQATLTITPADLPVALWHQ